ncbi:MAG: hypothetical protein K2Z81_08095, partial [Cyanobacteria bacterium]|nr:hypothetical protein [Cyanobacteriota bacterium]
VAKIWQKANAVDNNPKPDTWKLDNSGHLLEAGTRFQAEYKNTEGKPGELQKVTIDGDTYERTGPNQVTHTYKSKADGRTVTDLYDNVRNFSAQQYHDNFGGPFSGINIDVDYGSGSRLSRDANLYRSPENRQQVERALRRQ